MDKIYSAAEVCSILNVSRATFHNLVRRGDAPESVQIGKRKKYTETSIKKWLDKKRDLFNDRTRQSSITNKSV